MRRKQTFIEVYTHEVRSTWFLLKGSSFYYACTYVFIFDQSNELIPLFPAGPYPCDHEIFLSSLFPPNAFHRRSSFLNRVKLRTRTNSVVPIMVEIVNSSPTPVAHDVAVSGNASAHRARTEDDEEIK